VEREEKINAVGNGGERIMVSREQIILALIPVGFVVLYLADQKQEQKTVVSPAKEVYFLKYNNDEIFKNLLATEGHFRNMHDSDETDDKGFKNCCVKHLCDAESHNDEAVCHSLIVSDAETSEKYKQLAEQIKSLRHDVQEGNVNASQGIERVRQIRRQFEGFNPDFDISKCKACEVQV
jgi:hypothetical protein